MVKEITNEDIKENFFLRDSNVHKGNFGYVAIMGGCLNYAGAIKLASSSLSALRSGCGVLRLIIPESIAPLIGKYTLEQTLFMIKDEESHMLFNPKEIDEALRKIKAIAIGMGWGQGKENEKILQYIIDKYPIPMIIDADGLNTLSQIDLNKLKRECNKIILTPHWKEFERISKIPMKEIEKDPITYAQNFAKQYQVLLLLKGPTTIVTDGQKVYLVKRGCPGMATAGSGDVLSGVLLGLLGYLESNLLTVATGAYLAGIAGEMAQEKNTDIGMIASDTVQAIPEAIKQIRNN